jgi:hypothetical protein
MRAWLRARHVNSKSNGRLGEFVAPMIDCGKAYAFTLENAGIKEVLNRKL